MGLLELLDDMRGDATAVGELVAVGAGPRTDCLSLFFATGLGYHGACDGACLLRASFGAPRTGDEVREAVPQSRRVVRIEIDVVGDAVETEADGFDICGCGAVEVVDELNKNLLCHELLRLLCGFGFE
ncbi:hypothetical protein ADL03_20490 [Nocardia sp. NRRL S-836]|nr:hypothetical protein ADL03_20490 [Nocardia sp. NRRL S-836]